MLRVSCDTDECHNLLTTRERDWGAKIRHGQCYMYLAIQMNVIVFSQSWGGVGVPLSSNQLVMVKSGPVLLVFLYIVVSLSSYISLSCQLVLFSSFLLYPKMSFVLVLIVVLSTHTYMSSCFLSCRPQISGLCMCSFRVWCAPDQITTCGWLVPVISPALLRLVLGLRISILWSAREVGSFRVVAEVRELRARSCSEETTRSLAAMVT